MRIELSDSEADARGCGASATGHSQHVRCFRIGKHLFRTGILVRARPNSQIPGWISGEPGNRYARHPRHVNIQGVSGKLARGHRRLKNNNGWHPVAKILLPSLSFVASKCCKTWHSAHTRRPFRTATKRPTGSSFLGPAPRSWAPGMRLLPCASTVFKLAIFTRRPNRAGS